MTTSRDASQYDSIMSDVHTNHCELNDNTNHREPNDDTYHHIPNDDTDSVEEVVDEDSIPDIFKGQKKTHFSYIWLPENGQEYTLVGMIWWKCQRCKFPDLPLIIAVLLILGSYNQALS